MQANAGEAMVAIGCMAAVLGGMLPGSVHAAGMTPAETISTVEQTEKEAL